MNPFGKNAAENASTSPVAVRQQSGLVVGATALLPVILSTVAVLVLLLANTAANTDSGSTSVRSFVSNLAAGQAPPADQAFVRVTQPTAASKPPQATSLQPRTGSAQSRSSVPRGSGSRADQGSGHGMAALTLGMGAAQVITGGTNHLFVQSTGAHLVHTPRPTPPITTSSTGTTIVSTDVTYNHATISVSVHGVAVGIAAFRSGVSIEPVLISVDLGLLDGSAATDTLLP